MLTRCKNANKSRLSCRFVVQYTSSRLLCCSQVRQRRVDGVGLVINTTSATTTAQGCDVHVVANGRSIMSIRKNCMLTYVRLSCQFSSVCVALCLKLKELNHDNIKPFIGACVEPGHICYLMQCCSRGTLQVSF